MAARVLGGVLFPDALPMISEDLSLERTGAGSVGPRLDCATPQRRAS